MASWPGLSSATGTVSCTSDWMLQPKQDLGNIVIELVPSSIPPPDVSPLDGDEHVPAPGQVQHQDVVQLVLAAGQRGGRALVHRYLYINLR